MKKKRFFLRVLVLGLLSIALICIIMMSINGKKKLKEQVLVGNGREGIIDSQDSAEIAGFFVSRETSEEGAYLWDKTQNGNLQIYYKALGEKNLKKNLIYTSNRVSVAHNFYSLDKGILLLDMYYDEDLKLNFELIRIGNSIKKDVSSCMFKGFCERMPYINVIDLSITPKSEEVEEKILLNYDSDGISRLLLLGGTQEEGGEHLIVASAIYGKYENGTIENGKKITFAGGYENYIYYQMLYNSVGDPPPEVATFETTGKAILFRYNIQNGETERVKELDKIVLHINANDEYALLSEYDYSKPLIQSGKLVNVRKPGQTYTIPKVESGVDICESRFVEENRLVFYTVHAIYFIDLQECVMNIYELESNSFVFWSENGVYSTMRDSTGEIKFTFLSYSEIFD